MQEEEIFDVSSFFTSPPYNFLEARSDIETLAEYFKLKAEITALRNKARERLSSLTPPSYDPTQFKRDNRTAKDILTGLCTKIGPTHADRKQATAISSSSKQQDTVIPSSSKQDAVISF
eukprot:TRINITY_DN7780_c0_g1_i1.p1 TRINITY_DN7780_c0_g1~~TRINITY_DN7780_c0_g1_i1.p1  ORF type:complete len:119 (+),score=36.07 TRINITY_DN7780_c0_g1_i1:869-1225(+)